jgi:uncharacterized protein YueI
MSSRKKTTKPVSRRHFFTTFFRRLRQAVDREEVANEKKVKKNIDVWRVSK